MALIHENSQECLKSEADLFSLPPTQTAIENAEWVEYHPVANIRDGGGPIEFNVSGSSEDYIDLSATQLYLRVRVSKLDGTPLPDKDLVIPVNNFMHALFSQVDVHFNGRCLTNSSHCYAYRAYIEKLLNFGRDAKTGVLTAAGFYKDTAGYFSDFEKNEGMKKRAQFIEKSKSFDLLDVLHVDPCFMNRLIPNLVDVKIRLVRSKAAFCLMAAANDYDILIENASLFVRKVKLNPAVSVAHAKAMEKTPALYPYNRMLSKVYSVSQGAMSFVQDNVFLGAMPKKVIICMVDTEAFNGNYKSNPFEMKHFNANFIAIYQNGHPTPHVPFQPNFEAGNTIREYCSLFTGVGRLNEDRGIDISREEFGNGYTIFAFNLLPDLSDFGHLQLVRQGNLRVEVKFARPLPKTISILIFGEFQSTISITKSRSILCDFAS